MDFAQRGSRNSRYYCETEPERRGEEDQRNSSVNLNTPLTHHLQSQPSSSTDDLQPDGSGSGGAFLVSSSPDAPIPAADIEKEHMFDKVVTPSDVGKLNRLVIPKQHAERYFPLDSSTNEKGLLLNFEDRNGKPWRFRYSYWNSSQSYVMTKGWSRFVKEKRLDAGDTVSFGRGVGDACRDRLFIDWKRRPEAQQHPPRIPIHSPYSPMMSFAARSTMPWGRLYTPPPSTTSPYDHHHHHHHHHHNAPQGTTSYGYNNNPYLYLRSTTPAAAPSHFSSLGMQQMHYGSGSQGGSGSGSGDIGSPHYRSTKSPIVFDAVPLTHSTVSTTNSKRMRLFGVNFDCSSSSSTINAGDSQEIAGGLLSPFSSSLSSQVRPLPPALSLQLRLGDAAGSAADMVDSQADDKHTMSLDLDM